MISHDAVNVEQYNYSPVQIEHQVKQSYNKWQETQTTCLTNKMQSLNLSDDAMKILLNTITKLKIPTTLVIELLELCANNTYFIIDDSQSMSVKDTRLYEENTDKELTRMEELKIRLQSIAPIVCALAKYDIKIKILSNVDFTTIIYADLTVGDKITYFNKIIDSLTPTAGTPLITATTLIAADAVDSYKIKNTKSILYIFTDGEPNDTHLGTRKSGVDGFTAALRGINALKTGVLSIGISACTGDDNSMDWLTKLDKDLHIGNAINVQDDFFSEAKAMYYSQGNTIPFSNYGFYIATGLLAPLVPWIDNLNEEHNLTKEELSIATNKKITDVLYSEYIISATKARSEKWYQSYIPWSTTNSSANFELEIVSIDGKVYRRRILSDQELYYLNTTSPFTRMISNIYNSCNIL